MPKKLYWSGTMFPDGDFPIAHAEDIRYSDGKSVKQAIDDVEKEPGPQGPQGEPGPQGPPGKDGISPSLPNFSAKAGTNINVVGTPSVTYSNGVFTFDYVKGQKGDSATVTLDAIVSALGIMPEINKNLFYLADTTKTVNGVTYTINDGIITFSGTCTANTDHYIAQYPYISSAANVNNYVFDYETIFSYSKPSSSIAIPIRYQYVRSGTSTISYIDQTSINSDNITISAGTRIGGIYFQLKSGTNYNGLVLKPMIRRSTITDATFARYTMSLADISKRLMQYT